MSPRSSDIPATADRATEASADGDGGGGGPGLVPAAESIGGAIPLNRGESGAKERRFAERGRAEFDPDSIGELPDRIRRLESRNRILTVGLLLALAVGGFATFERLYGHVDAAQQSLMDSKELTLVDSEGNPRLFLRMFSRVPVLQIIDSSGKPRMSLGLRFDDTPFIDLSDKSGTTRATLEITESDTPALRLFDESGNVKFQIN